MSERWTPEQRRSARMLLAGCLLVILSPLAPNDLIETVLLFAGFVAVVAA